MVTDKEFYTKFRKAIIGEQAGAEEMKMGERVIFHQRQFEMIPLEHRELFCNISRGHPTPPIYAFLALGMIGTNIARYSVVRRVGANRTQAERTGAFYNFIAPSRLGKGIALSLITKVGSHIEEIRDGRYSTRLQNEPTIDAEGNNIPRNIIVKRSSILRPRSVFLTGANGLQTHAHAAANGGCGLIVVSEIKSGKARYTNAEGTYAPLLDFYDLPIASNTYRKAETIPPIKNCRIQLVAAGVKED